MTAFEVLYKKYIGELVSLINTKTGSLDVSKDLAQEVFLTVYAQKETISTIENFKAYLFGIAKHKVFNYYRHELIKKKYKDYIVQNKSDFDDNFINEGLENRQLLKHVQEQIERLPPKCKEVFKLSRLENLSYRSIAERLQISENTVDQHMQKALRILRSAVDRYNSREKMDLVILAVIFCSNS